MSKHANATLTPIEYGRGDLLGMIRGLAGVIIWTDDLDSMVGFYRGTLGLAPHSVRRMRTGRSTGGRLPSRSTSG